MSLPAMTLKPVGKVLTGDPRIAKFSFTGSTEIGKILLTQCATTVKKTSMELGENAPFTVFDDASTDDAVAGAMVSKFRNAGQTCVCTNCVFVQSEVHEEFTEKLTATVKNLSLGEGGQTAGTDIGPLINVEAANSVKELVDNAVSAGANIATGGHIIELGKCYY